MTIRVAQDVGMETIADYERFGVYKNMRPYLANSLGAEETNFTKWLQHMRCLRMVESEWNQLLLTVFKIDTETVYRHDLRICNECKKDNLSAGFGPEIFRIEKEPDDAITAYQLTYDGRVVIRGTASRTVKLQFPQQVNRALPMKLKMFVVVLLVI